MRFSVNRTKQALGELQTTLHWTMTIVNPPSAIGAMDEDTHIRCQSSGVPDAQEELNRVELQGHVINQVGKTTKNGTINLTFVEGTDARVTAWFTNLANARWSGDGSDTQGVQRLTHELKMDVKLELMGPDDTVTQTYTLIGALASMNKGITLSQTADAVTPNITLEYDDYHVSAGGATW